MRSTSILLLAFAAVFAVGQTSAQDTSGDDAARLEMRRLERDLWLFRADEAAQGALRAGTSEQAAALRRVEVYSRVVAELLADGAADSTVFDRALEIRLDGSAPERERFEVSRLMEMLLRKQGRYEDRNAWLGALEEGARRLIEEFPRLEWAHEALWPVALMADEMQAVDIAKEIVDSPAPEPVRRAAADLLRRYEIDGLDAASALRDAPGSRPLLESFEGRRVVLYTWMPEDAQSVVRAQALAEVLPRDCVAIGINLGPEVATALELAEQFGLPGDQLYGARGHDSPVVRQLALTVPGLLFGVSRDGVLHNLGSTPDLPAALEALK